MNWINIITGHWVEAVMAATVAMAGVILGQVLAGKSLRKIKVSQYIFGFVMLGYLFLMGISAGILNAGDYTLDIFRSGAFNLIPLAGFTMDYALMNALLFLPLGFLIPSVFHGMKRSGWGKVLLACFSVSLMVEILQLFHETRAFDINDLAFKTLGGIAGYGVYRLAKTLLNR